MPLTSALSWQRSVEAQHGNGFMWAAVAFGGGIALYFSLGVEPPVWIAGAAGLIALIAGAALWPRRDSHAVSFAFILLALFLSAGFMTAQWRAASVFTPMIVKETGAAMVEGTIDTIDMMGDSGDIRLVLRDVVIEDIAPEQTPRKIRLRLRQEADLATGQRVSGLASLNPPSPPVAPGAFDFQRQAYFEGIGAVGFFFHAPEILEAPHQTGLRDIIEGWRLHIADRVADRFDQPQAGLIIALMTGQQRAVAEKDYQAMRDSGLAHLLAISGMNVGMIAATLFFLSRLVMAAFPWFALRHPIKKYAAVIAFFGALIYTMIAGFSVPTQRAILMTGIVLLAICLDRSPFSLRLLAFAAFAVLLFTPENIMGVSFQMSFAAVMALIVFYDWARPFWLAAYSRAGWIRKGALYMSGVMITTLIGGTVTGLFSLYHFQTYALYNVFANMLAVPLTGVVIMPCAVAAMVLMPLGLEGWMLDGMAWGVTWMLAIARWVAGLDGAVLQVQAYPPALFLCMSGALLVFLLWQGRARWAGLSALIACLCLVPFARQPDILINQDASLFAIRTQSGMLTFSSGRGDRYAAETWLRRSGAAADEKRTTWPRDGRQEAMICDALACRWERNGHNISFLRSLRAIGEECAWADMVIAGFPLSAKECAAPIIIDRFSVWRYGAHSVYLKDGFIDIRRVEDERGMRPWTQTATRRN